MTDRLRHRRPAAFIFAFYIMMAVAFWLLCVFMYGLYYSIHRKKSQPDPDQDKSKDEKSRERL